MRIKGHRIRYLFFLNDFGGMMTLSFPFTAAFMLLITAWAVIVNAALDTGIHKHPSLDTWFMVTKKSTYVVGASADGYVVNLHWGKRLTQLDNLNATVTPNTLSQNPPITYAMEELPAFGGLRYRDNVLKVDLPDGTRELNLLYSGAKIKDDNLLDIELRDGNRTDFKVTLHYEVDTENDMIRRSYTVENGLSDRVNLDMALSAAWHPPTALNVDEKRELLTLAGEW